MLRDANVRNRSRAGAIELASQDCKYITEFRPNGACEMNRLVLTEAGPPLLIVARKPWPEQASDVQEFYADANSVRVTRRAET